jgi:ubiquitin C-terminal hydrolase
MIGFALGRNISFQRNRAQLDLNPEFQVIDITGQCHRFEVITVVYHEGGLYGHYTASKKNLTKGEWFHYNGGNIRGSVWSYVQERRADIVYVAGRKTFRVWTLQICL